MHIILKKYQELTDALDGANKAAIAGGNRFHQCALDTVQRFTLTDGRLDIHNMQVFLTEYFAYMYPAADRKHNKTLSNAFTACKAAFTNYGRTDTFVAKYDGKLSCKSGSTGTEKKGNQKTVAKLEFISTSMQEKLDDMAAREAEMREEQEANNKELAEQAARDEIAAKTDLDLATECAQWVLDQGIDPDRLPAIAAEFAGLLIQDSVTGTGKKEQAA